MLVTVCYILSPTMQTYELERIIKRGHKVVIFKRTLSKKVYFRVRSADINRVTISYTVTPTSGTIRLCICTIGPLIIPKFNYKGWYTETEYPVRSISDHQTVPNLNQYTVSESP